MFGTAWDAYEAYSTITDPEATDIEKAAVTAGLAAGIYAVGAGYGTAAKAAARSAFEKAFAKIEKIGNPQHTRGPGLSGAIHAARSENLAREMVAKIGANKVKAIHYNREIRSVIPGSTSRKKPDVIVETTDGKFHIGEIASPSQTRNSQQKKLDDMQAEHHSRVPETKLDAEDAKDAKDANRIGNWVGCDSGC